MANLREMKADGKVFLSKLTQFNASKEGIDDSMIQLLYKIVETISSCVDGKQHISKPLTDDLLFEIDQSQFMYYRSIRCLKCKDVMPYNLVTVGQHRDRCYPKKRPDVDSSPSTPPKTLNNLPSKHYHQSMLNISAESPRTVGQKLSQSMMNLALANGNNEIATLPFHEAYSKIFKKIFSSPVHLFGSYALGLEDEKSDLNIYIEFDYHYERHQVVMTERLQSVMTAMTKWTFFQDISSENVARNPSVKATVFNEQRKCAVTCAVTFGSGLYVETTKRIKDYMDALPMIRNFVDILKKWQRKLTSKAEVPLEFSTYQFVVLVIWYFQYRKYLPSVCALQTAAAAGGPKILCGDAMVNFSKAPKQLKPVNGDLKEYLKDFFNFFGNEFEADKHVISPYFGSLLLRTYKAADGPNEDNESLLKCIKNNPDWNRPNAFMYVQSLLLAHNRFENITLNLTERQVKTFLDLCKMSANI